MLGKAYIVADLGLPELDSFRSQGLDVSRGINKACPGRARTDVNSYVMILGRHGGLTEIVQVCVETEERHGLGQAKEAVNAWKRTLFSKWIVLRVLSKAIVC
jgi:hypothetical protein